MEQCSFCGKPIDEVKKLIRSPIRRNTYICDLCNGLISSIISEKGGKKENEEEEEGEKDKGSVYLPKELRHSAREDAKGFTPKLRNMKPSDICRKLDQYIIGQKRAKAALSVAVSNHVKRLQDMSGLIKKSNILLVGSSGTGKTLLAKTLADILNVPFAVLDATKISPTGYTGNDAEICLQQLLAKAKGNVQIAQRGVVFIDEIDKLAGLDETINQSKGGSNLNVQSGLLKLIEGCEVTLPASGKTQGLASVRARRNQPFRDQQKQPILAQKKRPMHQLFLSLVVVFRQYRR